MSCLEITYCGMSESAPIVHFEHSSQSTTLLIPAPSQCSNSRVRPESLAIRSTQRN